MYVEGPTKSWQARALPLADPAAAALAGLADQAVFASGDSVDELLDGLKEAVALYLGNGGETSTTELSELKLAARA
jgi:hypothetical protein